MLGSHWKPPDRFSLHSCSKFRQHMESERVTLAEILEVLGLLDKKGQWVEGRPGDSVKRNELRERGSLLPLRNVWAVGPVLLCKALFDSFNLNGGFLLG